MQFLKKLAFELHPCRFLMEFFWIPWSLDVVYLDFSKAFDSICLLIKMTAMGIHLKVNRWVEEYLKNRSFGEKLGGHLSSEGTLKVSSDPFIFLIFINDFADDLTWNHLFLADNVKLIAPRSQQHKLWSSIQQAFTWSSRWDLPLNASKSHNRSIRGPPGFRLALTGGWR